MKLSLISTLSFLLFSPPGLSRSLWSSKPAISSDVLRTAYPIGNGKLALLPFGEAGHETLSINKDSLWSGGPFENSSYQGGNDGPKYKYLPGIREWIFQNGTGNMSKLMGDASNYGSYAVLGNMSVTISGVENASEYERRLDLKTGVHTTSYSANGASFVVTSYCSYPDDVCVYDVASNKSLPAVSVSMSNTLTNASLVTTKCSPDQLQFLGTTQKGIGMRYQATIMPVGRDVPTHCVNDTFVVSKTKRNKLTLVLAAGTNFDQSKGNAAHNYSFRGEDPADYVLQTARSAAAKSSSQLRDNHIADYGSLANAFELEVPDTQRSSGIETEELVSQYNANGTTGDPYLESITFDFARYLFISSSRDGSLPPNLQGKWATLLSNAWSSDYHLDINLEMNHWHVDQTGLGALQTPLWEYVQQDWAPRGAETARLIYNATGWVVHSETNIFGFTGMKTGEEYWFDQPIEAAWMMQHVWDHFDYSQDVAWLNSSGYPMLRAISSFWLSQLQEDAYSKDGTLVVNPCTSAEHGPTTFGCTHWQQLIYQTFASTLQSASIIHETDKSFLALLKGSLKRLDKGLHIGRWNQIQEWKLDIDTPNDTHRHLSNLVGWYPGFSLSSYLDGYTNTSIQSAVETTLYSRGIGIIDSNAGWEKVWRSGCWARLNNTDMAHYELRLTIGENWAGNLLSMYSGKQEPFQIDANFGFAGAVLSMLVVDLPSALGDNGVRTVVLGPAIPAAWGNGKVRGLRLRGGGKVDFSWDGDGIVQRANLTGAKNLRIVNKHGKVLP